MYKYLGAKTKRVKLRLYYEKLKRKNSKKDKIFEDSEKKYSQHFFDYLKRKKFTNNSITEKYMRKKKVTIKIPEVCSVSQNPESLMFILKQISWVSNNYSIKKLILDYTKCTNLCISASSLITTFINNLKIYREKNNSIIMVDGIDSKSKKVNLILDVSGVKRNLGFSRYSEQFIDNMDQINQTDLITSNPIIKHSPKPKRSSSQVSTSIGSFIEKCYASIKKELNIEGKNKLSKFVAEIVDNCNIHPYTPKEGFSQWFVKAFFFKEGSNVGEISIIIYNFGQTIYESLKHNENNNDTKAKEMYTYLKKLCKINLKNGFTEEELWTLYSLQERISHLLSEKDIDRGSGTIEFIKNIQEISNENDTDIAMLSGNTMIIFDNKYKITTDKNNRSIISFNDENNLEFPPDKTNVKRINNKFPGTIYVFNFKINKDYLERK